MRPYIKFTYPHPGLSALFVLLLCAGCATAKTSPSAAERAEAPTAEDIPLISACAEECGGVLTDAAAYECAKRLEGKKPEFAHSKCHQTLGRYEAALTGRVPAQEPWGKISTPEYYASVIPKDNPMSEAKIRLGERLFNDTRLSANGQVSCATCHAANLAFTDGKKVSIGVGMTRRNAPTVLNALFNSQQFWDGRVPSLEEQAKLPMTNPVEMGLKDGDHAVRIVQGIPDYAPLFREAFGDTTITFDRIIKAIASFERTQISDPAPFDRYISGETHAISAAAKRGWSLFNGQARCISCHGFNRNGAFFFDNKFHNIGVAAKTHDFLTLAREGLALVETGNIDQIDRLAIEDPRYTELGRFLVTKNPADAGAFKTPTLRDIVMTGPYMHDGSMRTLWDVMDHYNKGGVWNPFLDGGITRLGLTESQINDLVEFLATLTSPRFEKKAKQELARQRSLSRTQRPERDTALAMGRKGSGSDTVIAQPFKDPARLGGDVPQPDGIPSKEHDRGQIQN